MAMIELVIRSSLFLALQIAKASLHVSNTSLDSWIAHNCTCSKTPMSTPKTKVRDHSGYMPHAYSTVKPSAYTYIHSTAQVPKIPPVHQQPGSPEHLLTST
eukprot:scpid35991/ scgid33962/ 